MVSVEITTVAEMPRDGTPILAYVVNRHVQGWQVIQYTGRY